jgi:glutathione synthase/RimK-type ligase-like ATP-grasp enzyme/gamma-glutamyl:cysteine ligase YbdK (ATP-grasp superfamily)
MKSNPDVLVVVSVAGELPATAGVVVTVDDYLAGIDGTTREKATVVNLCRSWRYLSKGYYVSLLADARGQTPIPTVEAIEELSNAHALFRGLHEAGVATIDIDEVSGRRRAPPERILASPTPAEASRDPDVPLIRDETADYVTIYRPAIEGEVAEAVVYLGWTPDVRFQRIASVIYRLWPTPILRIRLVLEEESWKVFQVQNVLVHKLSPAERDELLRTLSERPKERVVPTAPPEDKRASIAILYDVHDKHKASTLDTVERLGRVAARMGVYMHPIGLHELARLGDYDALFIRTLTGLSTPAFRFALRAEALGMPVIDDTRSIIRCSNKVYLHELLKREGVPTPRTATASRETKFADLANDLGLPFVVKLPDGSFSAAVFKIDDADDWERRSTELFKSSPLLITQAFTTSEFDWRVTTLGGKPLFVCKYHMVPGHWQIRNVTSRGARYGRVEAIPRDKAPRDVIKLACRASRLIGDGLYGVDLKQTKHGVFVIEVNDNPNIDIGYDDAAEGPIIYEELVEWFLERLDIDEEDDAKKPVRTAREKEKVDPMDAFREPIGEVPERESGRPYFAYEVCGIELEYAIVDRDLNAVSLVDPAMRMFAGRPTSDVTLGVVGFSNEIVDHVIEIKTEVPLKSLVETEELLVEGIRRFAAVLADRFDARLMPTGMHPWLDPSKVNLWTRSNRRIYDTYARLFDVKSHGWANVQSCHVNLPLGTDDDAVAMMNAASMIIPYLPAIAASTPMHDGALQPAVDNRLAWVLKHQTRVPESCGSIVPEPIKSIVGYKKDILGKMYEAVDRLPDAAVLRREFFNARGAVFKFSRKSMEIRVLDAQECVKVDMAIAAFVRAALRAVVERVREGKMELPDHAVLVDDFREVVAKGTNAQVRAPHFCKRRSRDDSGQTDVRYVLRELISWARRKARADEEEYIDMVERIVERGNLSECIARVLDPYTNDDEAFTDAARRVYIQLTECLLDNRPWTGRGL